VHVASVVTLLRVGCQKNIKFDKPRKNIPMDRSEIVQVYIFLENVQKNTRVRLGFERFWIYLNSFGKLLYDRFDFVRETLPFLAGVVHDF
jgi:hypothetical protein